MSNPGRGGLNDPAVEQKVREYQVLIAPIERALAELDLSYRMLRERTEEELRQVSPLLSAVGDVLDLPVLDLLLASDRPAYLLAAIERSGLDPDEVGRRVLALSGSGSGEELKRLGLQEPSEP